MRSVLPSAAPAAAAAAGAVQPRPQRHAQRQCGGPDPAGAGRFIGGVMGGMLR